MRHPQLNQNKNLPLLWAFVAGAGILISGCGPVIGWTLNTIAPPEKIKPVYSPPKSKIILVLVDDLVSPVAYGPIKGELTERLNEKLTEHKIAAETVPYTDLLKLISAAPNFNRLAVSEVGQKLGADLVLCVAINKFSLKDNEVSPLWRGHMETTVRIVDVEKGRLWPEDRPAGYPVKPIETPTKSHPSASYGIDVARTLAEKMADRIAKLFYTHKVSAQMGTWHRGQT